MTPDRLARDANTDGEARSDALSTINFSVASALLRELGERLVGKPHIALAELVKNSYDADARDVTIRFDGDRIDVVDNGHGMNFEDFKNFWMRIGSPHKQAQRFSRTLLRPMTGSKGVGGGSRCNSSRDNLSCVLYLPTTRGRNSRPQWIGMKRWRRAISLKQWRATLRHRPQPRSLGPGRTAPRSSSQG